MNKINKNQDLEQGTEINEEKEKSLSHFLKKFLNLLLLGFFGIWLFNQDFQPGFSRLIESVPTSRLNVEDHKQLTEMGGELLKMDRNRTTDRLENRLEHWKTVLEKKGKPVQIFKEGEDKVWLLSPVKDMGVFLEKDGEGTVERIFKSLPKELNQEVLEDFWRPPWSTLEFSSSGVESSRRQLRIYRSEGGAGTLEQHFRNTLDEAGWTSLDHEGDMMIFQHGSSRAWIQITPISSQCRITLLITH